MHLPYYYRNRPCHHVEDYKKENSPDSVNRRIAFSIDGADGAVKTGNRRDGPSVEPFLSTVGEADSLLFKAQPAKDHEVEEDDEAAGGEHQPTEDDILGIVAGCVGDGGVGEGFFLFVGDGHMIGVQAGEDEKGDEKIENVVQV